MAGWIKKSEAFFGGSEMTYDSEYASKSLDHISVADGSFIGPTGGDYPERFLAA